MMEPQADVFLNSDARKQRQRLLAAAVITFTGTLLVTIATQWAIEEPKIQQERILVEAPATMAPTELPVPLDHILFAQKENDPNNSLIIALKEQNEWKENQISSLTSELQSKQQHIENIELQLADQDNKIEEMMLVQSRIKNDSSLTQQDLEKRMEEVNNERLAKEHSVLILQNQLQAAIAKAEIDHASQIDRIRHLEETDRQLKIALGDKTKLLVQLEEQYENELAEVQKKAEDSVSKHELAHLKAKLEEMDNKLAEEHALRLARDALCAELNKALALQKDVFKNLDSTKHALVEAEEKLKHEHHLRMAKENLFSQLNDTLIQQKETLKSLDGARIALTEELEETKKQYLEHLNRMAESRKTNITSVVANGKHIHTVTKGETLSGISVRYYGTSKRCEDIYEANKDQIVNRNQIIAGTKLVIP